MRPRSNRNPKSGFAAWPRSAAAIVSLTATVAIVAPARAAILHNWAFDPGTQALTFTLPSGITPEFFLMAEPARIVLEIPDTTLGAVTTAQQYDGAVRSIRLSDVAGGARVVVELAPNTRLDPRHAELTPTPRDEGQTVWTLRPLLPDVPVAPVATAPATPAPAASAAPVEPAIAVPPTEPVAPAAPTATAPPLETPPEAPAPQADAPAPQADVVSAASTEGDVPAAAADTAVTDLPATAEATSPPTAPESSVPIAVTPSPDAPPAVTPERSAGSDLATSTTTGAAQALPMGPDPLAGISTEADGLTGTPADSLSDLPPEQLPQDPAAASSPLVSVPDLAEVPEAPAVTQNPAISTAPTPSAPVGAPEQPPTAAPAAATAPPIAPATAAPPEVTSSPPTPAAIAANSLEVPTIALPPQSWRDRDEVTAAPDTERPPAPGAIAPPPSAIAAPPPAAATAATPPPAANSAAVAPPFLASPPPAAVPPRSQAAPPVPGSEPLTMPPPPTAIAAPDTLPFGTPLPPTESRGGSAPASVNRPQSVLPPGTRLSLQYVGATPLVIAEPEPVYEVLLVAQTVYDPATGAVLLPVGTQVIGRFEQINELGRRFVAQSIVQGSDRLPLAATSGRLAGIPQPDGVEVALGSGIGAAAMTLLTGFSGIGLLGGAAMGAFAGLAESPPLVTIAPGTVIEVQVVADSLPITTPPPAVSPPRL